MHCITTERRQTGQKLIQRESQQCVSLDEHIEIDRVEIASPRIGEPRDVPRRNSASHPIHKRSPFITGEHTATRRLPQAPKRLAREWLEYRITNAEKAIPRRGVVDDQALPHLG